MSSTYVNELRPELVGVHSFNFGIAHNSPSRSQMMGSHLSQKLVIQGSEPASDEFLDALKKKKDETVKLHQEGENMINLQRVRNTELEQEIDMLNNLIELYSKKKP